MATSPSAYEMPTAVGLVRETAAVHALTPRDQAADSPWIAVVDSRPGRREFICNFLVRQAALNGRVLPLEPGEPPTEPSVPAGRPSMIIFSVGGLSIADPKVSKDFERLHARFEKTPIVVLSDLDAGDEAQLALAAGAHGFVPTMLDPMQMCAALALIQTGGKYAPPALFDEWVQSTPSSRLDPGEEPTLDVVPQYDELTPRQTHVLHLLQEGFANKVIATKLGMTESTVKVHVRQIMRRLGANNRTEAALLAQRHQEALRRRAS